MSKFAIGLCAAAVVVAAAGSGTSYLRTLRADVATAQRQRDDARRSLADRDDMIHRLQKDAAEKALQQAQLDRAHTEISRKLGYLQTTNRRLIDENAELRAWADTPLPHDVVRMQASPALSGADDYLDHVPSGEPVHAAGNDAENER